MATVLSAAAAPRRWLHAAVVAVPVLLASCTTTRHAPDPVRAPDAAQETGTVIVSLTANTLETRPFDSITLTRLDASGQRNRVIESRELLRNVLARHAAATTLFVGAVTPGDYQLRQLSSAGLSLALPETVLGSFTVREREVTDLGRLVLTSVNEQAMVGRSQTVQDNRAFVARHSPEHLALYRQTPASTWNSARQAGDNAEAYARHHPLGAGAFRRLSNGERVGGARMGILLVRGVNGQWRTAVTHDEMETFTAVAPDEHAGTLAIAGTDLGTLVRLRNNGALETVDRGDLPRGTLVFLDRSPDRRLWVAGLREAGQLSFYASPLIDRGTWTPFAALAAPGAAFRREAARFWTWTFPGGFGFAASSDPTLSCFDYASGQWRTGAAPLKRNPYSMLVSDRGVIGLLTRALAGQTGDYETGHVSADCGQNWRDIGAPPEATVSAPLPLEDGAILRAGSDAAGAAVFVSRDLGRTWQRSALDAPVLRERLWSFGSDVMAATQRRDVEELRSSRDGGMRWTTELSRVSASR